MWNSTDFTSFRESSSQPPNEEVQNAIERYCETYGKFQVKFNAANASDRIARLKQSATAGISHVSKCLVEAGAFKKNAHQFYDAVTFMETSRIVSRMADQYESAKKYYDVDFADYALAEQPQRDVERIKTNMLARSATAGEVPKFGVELQKEIVLATKLNNSGRDHPSVGTDSELDKALAKHQKLFDSGKQYSAVVAVLNLIITMPDKKKSAFKKAYENLIRKMGKSIRLVPAHLVEEAKAMTAAGPLD